MIPDAREVRYSNLRFVAILLLMVLVGALMLGVILWLPLLVGPVQP